MQVKPAGRVLRASVSDVQVRAMEPGHYGVQVQEGQATTSHRVEVPSSLLESLGLGQEEGEALVEESFAFLLEREPATSILTEFTLSDIGRYFDDYGEEIARRMAAR